MRPDRKRSSPFSRCSAPDRVFVASESWVNPSRLYEVQHPREYWPEKEVQSLTCSN